jgi:O-antigen/teichoic acid export membrane protein
MARSDRNDEVLAVMSIRTLSVDFVFYGVLDLLQRSISIIMVPVYTRVLTQKEYGDLDIIIIVASVLFVVVDLQVIAGFTRMYYERHERGDGRRFVGTAIVARLVAGTLIAAGFVVLGSLGHLEFSFMPSFLENRLAWMIAVATIPFILTYDVLLLQARMLRAKSWFAVGALSASILSGVLSVLFAVVWKWGIVSVVLAMLVAKIVGVLALWIGLRNEISLEFDSEIFRELMRYTAPLMPAFWLSFASVYVSRFFIFAKVGAEENAILAVCMKMAVVIGMFAIAFESAWQPLAMKQIGDRGANEFYVRSMRLFVAGNLLIMFVITAFLDPILSILAPESYDPVKYYFPLFAVGMVLSTLAKNVQLGHQIAKSTHWISIIAFISSLVNLVILILFSGRYGILAAGVGWLSSFGVMLLLSYSTAQRNYYIPYDLKAFALFAVGCIALLLIGVAGYRQAIPGWLFSFVALLCGAILSWSVIGRSDRWAIISHLRTRLSSKTETAP